MSDPAEFDPDERFSLDYDAETVIEKLLGTKRENEDESPEGDEA